MKSGFTSLIRSTNSPLILNRIRLPSSFGIFACRYAPGTSKLATSLPSYASMISEVMRPSRDTVGKAILSFSLRYKCCLLPFAQVVLLFLPFFFPLLDSLHLVLVVFFFSKSFWVYSINYFLTRECTMYQLSKFLNDRRYCYFPIFLESLFRIHLCEDYI